MSKVILTILLIISSITCKSENDKMSKIFSRIEMTQLIHLINQLDSIVIDETGMSNLEDAYLLYYQRLYGINFSDTIKLSKQPVVKLVAEFDTIEVFSQIWIKKDYANYRLGTVGEFLFFNKDGKYIEFLKLLSENNDFCKKYYDEISFWNELSIPARVLFTQRYEELDICNLDFHFLYVVHVITEMYGKELAVNSFGIGVKGDTIDD